MKREDYISWDEYFMGIAMLSAMRSKDNNSQVGACIVSPDNIILSTGYNGLPCSCSDDVFPWEREGAETKYPYVVHAELNAILNASKRMLDAAGVRYHPLQTELASITLDFRAPESAGIPQKSDADEK